jgi:HK97 family phage portal protein
MNIFDKAALKWLNRRSLANPDKWTVRWFLGGGATKSGTVVSEQAAFECLAFLACTRVLAETLASLPLKVYRRLPSGGKEEAKDHPLYPLLAWAPNPEWTSFDWRERAMADCCIWGESINQIIMDGKNTVRQIWPLDPGRIKVERPDPEGPRVFRFRKKDGTLRTFQEDEILHIPLLFDGLRGRSLVNLCRESIGLTITAEQVAAIYYANDATPPAVMEADGNPGPATIKQMMEVWDERHKGTDGRHKLGWLWGGMKMRLVERDISKTQLLEVRKYQLEEMARLLRVPLHLVQSLDRATNNNIEHQGIDYVVHTARPWSVRFEQRTSMGLFGPRERSQYFAEFDLNGLQRGDYVSRTTGYSRAIASAWMTPNEARALENMNPIEGGDRLFIQGAMVPVEMAGAKFQQKQKAQPAQ